MPNGLIEKCGAVSNTCFGVMWIIITHILISFKENGLYVNSKDLFSEG